jgi:hypothetical protein
MNGSEMVIESNPKGLLKNGELRTEGVCQKVVGQVDGILQNNTLNPDCWSTFLAHCNDPVCFFFLHKMIYSGIRTLLSEQL